MRKKNESIFIDMSLSRLKVISFELVCEQLAEYTKDGKRIIIYRYILPWARALTDSPQSITDVPDLGKCYSN